MNISNKQRKERIRSLFALVVLASTLALPAEALVGKATTTKPIIIRIPARSSGGGYSSANGPSTGQQISDVFGQIGAQLAPLGQLAQSLAPLLSAFKSAGGIGGIMSMLGLGGAQGGVQPLSPGAAQNAENFLGSFYGIASGQMTPDQLSHVNQVLGSLTPDQFSAARNAFQNGSTANKLAWKDFDGMIAKYQTGTPPQGTGSSATPDLNPNPTIDPGASSASPLPVSSSSETGQNVQTLLGKNLYDALPSFGVTPAQIADLNTTLAAQSPQGFAQMSADVKSGLFTKAFGNIDPSDPEAIAGALQQVKDIAASPKYNTALEPAPADLPASAIPAQAESAPQENVPAPAPISEASVPASSVPSSSGPVSSDQPTVTLNMSHTAQDFMDGHYVMRVGFLSKDLGTYYSLGKTTGKLSDAAESAMNQKLPYLSDEAYAAAKADFNSNPQAEKWNKDNFENTMKAYDAKYPNKTVGLGDSSALDPQALDSQAPLVVASLEGDNGSNYLLSPLPFDPYESQTANSQSQSSYSGMLSLLSPGEPFSAQPDSSSVFSFVTPAYSSNSAQTGLDAENAVYGISQTPGTFSSTFSAGDYGFLTNANPDSLWRADTGGTYSSASSADFSPIYLGTDNSGSSIGSSNEPGASDPAQQSIDSGYWDTTYGNAAYYGNGGTDWTDPSSVSQ